MTVTRLGGGDEEQRAHSAHSASPVRFLLGAHRAGARGAAVGTPVPEGAVVVGSGDAAAVLTPAQADALRAAGLEAYASLKDRALISGGALVAGGALLLAAGAAAADGGGDAALLLAWLAGGGAGLGYGWALQSGVDAVGAGTPGRGRGRAPPGEEVEEVGSTPEPSPPLPFPARLFASPPARIALIAALGLAALGAASHGGKEGADALTATTSHPGPARLALLRQLLTAAAGFSMYKVGLIATVAAADAGVAGPRARRGRGEEAASDDEAGDGGSRAGAAAGGGGGPGVDSAP